jgi:hypothetical protein
MLPPSEISIMLFFIGLCALFYMSGRWDSLRTNLKRQFDLMLPDQQQKLINKIAVGICVVPTTIVWIIFDSLIPHEVVLWAVPVTITGAALLGKKLAPRIQ